MGLTERIVDLDFVVKKVPFVIEARQMRTP